jgi:hypothetical protein
MNYDLTVTPSGAMLSECCPLLPLHPLPTLRSRSSTPSSGTFAKPPAGCAPPTPNMPRTHRRGASASMGRFCHPQHLSRPYLRPPCRSRCSHGPTSLLLSVLKPSALPRSSSCVGLDLNMEVEGYHSVGFELEPNTRMNHLAVLSARARTVCSPRLDGLQPRNRSDFSLCAC